MGSTAVRGDDSVQHRQDEPQPPRTRDEPDFVRAALGENWDRLVELKRKYDPTNVFRLNQNIDPTGTV